MRKLLLAFCVMMAFCCSASKLLTVVESGTSEPLEFATVISSRGLILGVTDKNGQIKVDQSHDFPLEIRSMGYEAASMPSFSDTIALNPAVYQLSELTVRPGERPIMKVTCFAREFSTGATDTDTLQLYSDCMLVSYHAPEKTKGYKSGDSYPIPRLKRGIARFADSHGRDSIAFVRGGDDIAVLSFMNLLTDLPKQGLKKTDAIKGGAKTDTVMGKYSVAHIFRNHDNLYTHIYDYLGNEKDHVMSPALFKLIGMTMDIDNLQRIYTYRDNDEGIYSPEDFIFMSGSLHALAKGKMFRFFLKNKSDLDLDCYAELYPVEIEYLTLDEYKADRKTNDPKNPIEFRRPANLQPLPPAVVRILDAAEKSSMAR